MGDFPDFSNMSEEEQMRWLESLAARQGANTDEFTTAADMEVEEIDPDSVVIDEPGYVPSETFSFSKHNQPQEDSVAETLPTETPTSSEAVQTGEYQAMIDDDPMAFLESLAARQGANPEEFTTDANLEVPEIDPDSVVIDEPGYVPSETFSFQPKLMIHLKPVAEVAEDESWLEASDDFLDGADLDFSQLDDMAEPIVEAGENEDWLEASDTFP